MPDRDIQLILGHSDVSVTKGIYEHDDLDDRRRALGGLEQQLTNNGSGRDAPEASDKNEGRFPATGMRREKT